LVFRRVLAEIAARPIERLLRGDQLGAVNDAEGSIAGTPGSDRLARDLPFATACQSADEWVHPDPAITRRSRPAASRRVNTIAALLQSPVTDHPHTHLGLQARAPNATACGLGGGGRIAGRTPSCASARAVER